MSSNNAGTVSVGSIVVMTVLGVTLLMVGAFALGRMHIIDRLYVNPHVYEKAETACVNFGGLDRILVYKQLAVCSNRYQIDISKVVEN